MSRPSTLAEVQQQLRALIAAPSGVAAALAERGESGRRELDATLRSDARLSAVDRLEIYANAYFYRIHDALCDDYGALRAALGDAAFHDLVTAYLIAHPPSRPSLRHAGAQLADFLATSRALASLRERLPWGADLARLECAILDAFDAEDAPVVSREELAAVAPERWAELRFEFQPALRWVDAAWPVPRVRSAFDRDEPVPQALDPSDARIRPRCHAHTGRRPGRNTRSPQRARSRRRRHPHRSDRARSRAPRSPSPTPRATRRDGRPSRRTARRRRLDPQRLRHVRHLLSRRDRDFGSPRAGAHIRPPTPRVASNVTRRASPRRAVVGEDARARAHRRARLGVRVVRPRVPGYGALPPLRGAARAPQTGRARYRWRVRFSRARGVATAVRGDLACASGCGAVGRGAHVGGGPPRPLPVHGALLASRGDGEGVGCGRSRDRRLAPSPIGAVGAIVRASSPLSRAVGHPSLRELERRREDASSFRVDVRGAGVHRPPQPGGASHRVPIAKRRAHRVRTRCRFARAITGRHFTTAKGCVSKARRPAGFGGGCLSRPIGETSATRDLGEPPDRILIVPAHSGFPCGRRLRGDVVRVVVESGGVVRKRQVEVGDVDVCRRSVDDRRATALPHCSSASHPTASSPHDI